ncbi:MAG: aminoacyl-tRNA hydrolase [Proteobacteria bacterium]|nr:aminoacyl-tRNA hydrolase [Pseudomonadota bacterium]
MEAVLWLIAGLGNPGRKYERNRHNVGFRVADTLARRHGMGSFREQFGGEMASGRLSVAGRYHRAVILKPMQFMNRSGFAIVRTAHYFDIEATNILVIHDEIDLPFGRMKLKAGGGHGGHNGLRSIIQELGSRDFLRIRLGVGKPGPPPPSGDSDSIAASEPSRSARRTAQVAGHVLSNFPGALEAEVTALVERAADAAEAIVSDGIRPAMNRFHSPAPAPAGQSQTNPQENHQAEGAGSGRTPESKPER